jgi:hypothetical protein
LAAREDPRRPEALARVAIETATPVARDKSWSPRRRRSLLVTAAVLVVGAAGSIAGVVALRDRSATPGLVSSPSAAPTTLSAPPIVALATGEAPSAAPATTADAAPGAVPNREKRALVSPALGSAAPKASAHLPQAASALPAASTAASIAGQVAEPAASEHPGARPNCKPPFYYDAAWNRVFKKECL